MKTNTQKGLIAAVCCLFIVLGAILCINIGATETVPEIGISSAALSLDDNIHIYFRAYYEGIDTAADEYGMIFYHSVRADGIYTYDIAVSDNATIVNTPAYWHYDETVAKNVATYKWKTAAKEMNDFVYAQAYAKKGGTYYYGGVLPYSVTTYAKRMLGFVEGVTGTTDETLRLLLMDILQYGASAQRFLNYNTDNLATSAFAGKYVVQVYEGSLLNGSSLGIYDGNTQAVVMPRGRDGYAFVRWEDEYETVLGTEPALDINITKDLSLTAIFEETTETLEYTESGDGESYTVSGIGTWTNPKLVIPAEHNGKPVTGINKDIFRSNEVLQYVTVSSGVTSIGNGLFSYCDTLKRITIPDSVTSLGGGAFNNCENLEKANIPNGITSIGSSLFSGCIKLESITIPDSVVSIDQYAFSSCKTLQSINIPAGLTSIGDGAFGGCGNITSITVDINNPVYHVTDNCLIKTESKTLMYGVAGSVIPADGSVTSIGASAFSAHTDLTDISIPQTVTSIGNSAFYGCTGLSRITIPSSVTEIGAGAFSNCRGLQSITIPNGVTEIGQYAFSGCTGLASASIPGSVTKIGDGAFSRCTALTPGNISINDNVTGIGVDVFSEIKDYNNASNWTNGALYIGNHLVAAKDTISGAYVIEAKAKTIADKAFYNCSKMTSLTVPSGVKSIGISAFDSCSTLASVTINGSNLISIGDRAFAGNWALAGINIPSSVTDIGSEAFNYCSSLVNITLPSGLTKIGYNTFNGCTKLSGIDIPGSVSSIGASAFESCSALASVTIRDGVISIDSRAFYSCSALTSVTIPDSVERIEIYAFRGCNALESIMLPFVGNKSDGSDNTHFGYIFGSYFPDSQSSYIPASLKTVTVTGGSIAPSAFYGCSGLTNIIFGSGVTSIGGYAFRGCTGLTSITVGSGATSIGGYAFYGCSGLQSITIPKSVESIEGYVFLGCDALSTVTYLGTEAEWNAVTKDTHWLGSSTATVTFTP